MKTGNTECIGCTQPYLNCYQTCPKSPAQNNDISLTPIQTPKLEQCDNGYKREMRIKAEVAREIFEEIYKSVASKIPMGIRPIFKDDRDFDGGFINGKRDALLDVLVLIAELKKKYTEDKE